MKINWFPGHMAKALREMKSDIKNIDIIFYCLDSRCPFSCLSPNLKDLLKGKEVIYILNKSDLVQDKDIQRFKSNLGLKNTIALDSRKSSSAKVLFLLSKNMLKDKLKSKEKRGLSYIPRAMVIGVPNVGKSTLINNLCGKYKAITGKNAGVTKSKEWLNTGSDLILLDTPGTLMPSTTNEKILRHLAYIGSIKDEAVNLSDLAFNFLGEIKEKYGINIEGRYGIKIDDKTALQILGEICKSKGYMLHGEMDYDRCGKMVIYDFRKGRLGKIALE